MPHLTERQSQILAALIQEYIHTARPVGSSQLRDLAGIDISSATIRSEVHLLEEAGYLYQPHTSAGRIPTDAGYRYYVDNIRDTEVAPSEASQIEQQYRELLARYQHMNRSVAKLLSLLSHSVVVTGMPEVRDMQLAGLRELLAQPEGTDHQAVQEISEVVEGLDAYVDNFMTATERGPKVFIGEEIPFMSARHTSVVVAGAHPEEEQPMMLVIVGPKRMPYRRNMQLLQAVSDIIEEQADEY